MKTKWYLWKISLRYFRDAILSSRDSRGSIQHLKALLIFVLLHYHGQSQLPCQHKLFERVIIAKFRKRNHKR